MKSLPVLPRTTIRILRHLRGAISAPGRISSRRGAAKCSYSIIQSTFHQIVADAFQRMVLRNTTPEEAYQEVVTKYNEAVAKTK